MPFFLLVGMGFATFFAGMMLLVIALMAITVPFSHSFSVNGHAANRGEFLADAWPLFLLLPLVGSAILGVCYALWRELPWSRTAILGYWFLGFVAIPAAAFIGRDSSKLLPSLLLWGAFTAGIWWYLYRKRSVVAYYLAVSLQNKKRRGGPGFRSESDSTPVRS